MNKFNLIENANDFLEHALKYMGPIEEKENHGVPLNLALAANN